MSVSTPLYDRVMETSTTTGTGTLTLAGAVTAYRAFSTVGNANLCTVLIAAVDASGVPTGAWEICRSTYTLSGTTLSRGRFIASSTGSRVSFAAGTKRVSLVSPAELLQPRSWDFVLDFDGDNTGASDMAATLTSALATIVTAGGGELYFPPGTYLLSGGLQDTGAGGANAQVPFPQVDGANPSTTGQKSLILRGCLPGPTSGESSQVPTGQSIIKSTFNTASGTFPSVFASKDGLRNNLHVRIQDLVFQCPADPKLTCLNLGMQQDVILQDLLLHTGSMTIGTGGVTEPTGSSYGVIFPQVNKATLTKADGIMTWGFATGYKLGELMQGGRFNAEACKVGMEIPAAYHANYITTFGAFECYDTIRSSGGNSYVMIGLLDIENGTAGSVGSGLTQAWQTKNKNIVDGSNLIHGRYNFHAVDAGVGTPVALSNTGGSNFTGTDL